MLTPLALAVLLQTPAPELQPGPWRAQLTSPGGELGLWFGAVVQESHITAQVVAFPTTLFLDARGRVRAVHTGWSGPATGAEHERLKAEIERLVEDLLEEDAR